MGGMLYDIDLLGRGMSDEVRSRPVARHTSTGLEFSRCLLAKRHFFPLLFELQQTDEAEIEVRWTDGDGWECCNSYPDKDN